MLKSTHVVVWKVPGRLATIGQLIGVVLGIIYKTQISFPCSRLGAVAGVVERTASKCRPESPFLSHVLTNIITRCRALPDSDPGLFIWGCECKKGLDYWVEVLWPIFFELLTADDRGLPDREEQIVVVSEAEYDTEAWACCLRLDHPSSNSPTLLGGDIDKDSTQLPYAFENSDFGSLGPMAFYAVNTDAPTYATGMVLSGILSVCIPYWHSPLIRQLAREFLGSIYDSESLEACFLAHVSDPPHLDESWMKMSILWSARLDRHDVSRFVNNLRPFWLSILIDDLDDPDKDLPLPWSHVVVTYESKGWLSSRAFEIGLRDPDSVDSPLVVYHHDSLPVSWNLQ